MPKVSKGYLKVQGIQKIPKDPRYPKRTLMSKVSKRYIMVQCILNYVKVQGTQKVSKGSRYPNGT